MCERERVCQKASSSSLMPSRWVRLQRAHLFSVSFPGSCSVTVSVNHTSTESHRCSDTHRSAQDWSNSYIAHHVWQLTATTHVLMNEKQSTIFTGYDWQYSKCLYWSKKSIKMSSNYSFLLCGWSLVCLLINYFIKIHQLLTTWENCENV